MFVVNLTDFTQTELCFEDCLIGTVPMLLLYTFMFKVYAVTLLSFGLVLSAAFSHVGCWQFSQL
jgi:hypothetical protein